jgi:hypothetical protein
LSIGSPAQSIPTASQEFQLSVFAASTSTFTDLAGDHNMDLTAGIDLTFLAFRSINAAVELRGSYPITNGSVSDQKNFVLGPKIEYPIKNIRPYVNFLVGRGRINYLSSGYIFDNFKYLRSDSLVLSPGMGLSLPVTHRTAIKTDFQYQSWATPAVLSGRISPWALSFGASYNFDFNSRHLE